MSSTIELTPPPAEKCLDTSRASRFWGGTRIAEDVHDLDEHRRRVAAPDSYRPVPCPRCGGSRVHVHDRVDRHPRGESSLPAPIVVLKFRCFECAATWRVLPAFLAPHLWHAWRAVERAIAPSAAERSNPSIAPRTQARWRSRLASSARVLVVLLAMSGGSVLEEIAKRVGLLGTRSALVDEYACLASLPSSERLSSLGALLQRLERGIRLM